LSTRRKPAHSTSVRVDCLEGRNLPNSLGVPLSLPGLAGIIDAPRTVGEAEPGAARSLPGQRPRRPSERLGSTHRRPPWVAQVGDAGPRRNSSEGNVPGLLRKALPLGLALQFAAPGLGAGVPYGVASRPAPVGGSSFQVGSFGGVAAPASSQVMAAPTRSTATSPGSGVAGVSGTDPGQSSGFQASDWQSVSTTSAGSGSPSTSTKSAGPKAQNRAPSARGEAYATDVGKTLAVPAKGVLANDSDPDGNALSAVLVAGPANGSLAFRPDGSFDYTPAPGFSGADSFTYVASDGALRSDPVTVPLTVNASNRAPVAAPDTYAARSGAGLGIAAPGVLANDSDPDGNALSAALVSGPTHGSLVLRPNGSFDYTPAPGFAGTDRFKYAASDGALRSAPVTVTLRIPTVTPVNRAPIAAAEAFTTDAGRTLAVPARGVLANDFDPDGNALSAVLVANPAHGSLAFRPDGSFDYTPAPGFAGADSFTYAASDGALRSAPVTVPLTINPVNRAPIASADSYTTAAGRTLTLAAPGVLANDSDPDGDALSAVMRALPAHGQVTLNPGGAFTYIPNAGYSGPDSFSYQAMDLLGALSAETTVSIVVSPASGGLDLASARVLADGRIVQLTFETDPVPAAHGLPDWRPGFEQGARLTLSTGASLEFVGAWATPYDRPVGSDDAGPAGDPATTLLPGVYHVAYSLVRDADGVEEQFSTPFAHTVAAGGTFYLGRMAGVHVIPQGYTANLYLSAPDGGPGTMTLYRTRLAPTPDASAEMFLNDRVWADPAKPWPGPARLTWTAHWLATDPAQVVTIAQAGLTVSAPAGLLVDAFGNATAAFSGVAAANRSLVDADGFTSGSFTRGAGGLTVYVSSTRGDDARDLAAAGNPATPVATLERADEILSAAAARDKGSAIRFLRGDSIAVDWGVYLNHYGGPDRLHPAVFESYWHAAFGADPGTRPVLSQPARQTIFNAAGVGGRANTVIRGLHVKGGGLGLNAIFGTNDLTLDDNILEGQATTFNSAGVTYLRNIFRDIYNVTGHSQAIYEGGGADTLVSQNAFDYVGRKSVDLQGMNVFSHAIYHQYDNRPIVLWGNMFREAEAVQMRAGGVAAYNVFTRVANSLFVASPGGYIYKNVVERCRDIITPEGDVLPRGAGPTLGVTSRGLAPTIGSVAEFNFVLNEESVGTGFSFGYRQAPGVVVRNNTISRAGLLGFAESDAPGVASYRATRNIMHDDEGMLFEAYFSGGRSWYESDGNLLSPPANGTGQTSRGTLATWKATTNSEANSVEAAPDFVNPTAGLGGFDALHGGDGTEAAHVAAQRARAAGTWGDRFDATRTWAFYATQYRPAASPAGTGAGPWDYYGAADYRDPE
jgi:hypothetical protein